MRLLVRDVGEFGLIERLRSLIERSDERVMVGIGDDAAVAVYRRPVVMTTDALVEGVHFRADLIDVVSTGYKALVASLSDIAAMGGHPLHALVTLAVPESAEVEPLLDLYRGLREACDCYGVSVIGGDVVSTSGPLVISVAVTGELIGDRPLVRGGAKPNDVIFVTGDVGGAAAYIHLREHPAVGHLAPSDEWLLARRHQRPVPQLQAVEVLALAGLCTAANDVSDGLCSELHEIAQASDARMVIDAQRIPTLPALRNYGRIAGVDPLFFALYGGEDYQIVGTVSRNEAGAMLSRFDSIGVRISLIGHVEDGAPGVELIQSGVRKDLPKRGYDHFDGGRNGS